MTLGRLRKTFESPVSQAPVFFHGLDLALTHCVQIWQWLRQSKETVAQMANTLSLLPKWGEGGRQAG